MKIHPVTNTNSFIGGWYIDNTICDGLVDTFEQYYKKGLCIERPAPKNYIGLDIPNTPVITEYLVKHLQPCLNEYLNKYIYANHCERFTVTEANIQKYNPEKFYDTYHFENSGGIERVTRHLVFMTYLNTIDAGGYTEFFYQNIKVKPEKGLTLIWPAQWTHTHRGSYTKQIKYVCTGWYNFIYEQN